MPGHESHGLRDDFAEDGVCDYLPSLENHRAAGCNATPGDLFEYLGGTGLCADRPVHAQCRPCYSVQHTARARG